MDGCYEVFICQGLLFIRAIINLGFGQRQIGRRQSCGCVLLEDLLEQGSYLGGGLRFFSLRGSSYLGRGLPKCSSPSAFFALSCG